MLLDDSMRKTFKFEGPLGTLGNKFVMLVKVKKNRQSFESQKLSFSNLWITYRKPVENILTYKFIVFKSVSTVSYNLSKHRKDFKTLPIFFRFCQRYKLIFQECTN